MKYIKWPERVWEPDEPGQWVSRPVSQTDLDSRKEVAEELTGNG